MLLQRSFAAGGIAVDTRDRHLREQRRRGLLQLLGADPYRHQMRGAAGRTLARDRALAVAMVAAQMVLRPVQRIVTVAARAFRYPAAIVAQQRWRKAAAVKKQDHWLSACRCWRIRLISAGDRPACSGCPLRSSTCCWAGRALPARLLKVNWRYLPRRTLCRVSSAGVAEPRIIGICSLWARHTASRGHGSASLPAACRSCHALRR